MTWDFGAPGSLSAVSEGRSAELPKEVEDRLEDWLVLYSYFFFFFNFSFTFGNNLFLASVPTSPVVGFYFFLCVFRFIRQFSSIVISLGLS